MRKKGQGAGGLGIIEGLLGKARREEEGYILLLIKGRKWNDNSSIKKRARYNEKISRLEPWNVNVQNFMLIFSSSNVLVEKCSIIQMKEIVMKGEKKQGGPRRVIKKAK